MTTRERTPARGAARGSRRAAVVAPVLAVTVLVGLLVAPALADEYTVSEFGGGYVTPPGNAVARIANNQDDATVAVNLPFEFVYFGRRYTSVSVCSNGWMAFGSTTAAVSANPALPTTAAPDAIAAPLWDDLKTGAGAVRTFSTGTAPSRTFTIAWEGVDTFAATDADDLSFQVHLHEETGILEFAYAPDGTWDGLSFTAGIEDHTGTVAFGAPNTDNTNAGQPLIDQRFTPTPFNVGGRLLRDRPVADETGLGNSTESGLAVGGVDLVLVREDLNEIVASGRSAADGTFALTALAVDDPLTFELRVLASGAAARVTDMAGAVFSHTLATDLVAGSLTDVGTITLDDAVDADNSSIRRALNIQQAAERGLAFAQTAAAESAASVEPPVSAETFPQVQIRWQIERTVTGGSQYFRDATGAITFIEIDDGGNADPYDDDVILREYGHHVLSVISVHPPADQTRSFVEPRTESSAFADGFAFWFASVVQGRARIVDTRAAMVADVFDLEAPTPEPQKAPTVTGAVAASFWDLVDPADEPHDRFEGTATGEGSTAIQVFTLIDQQLNSRMDGEPSFTFAAFASAFRAGMGEENERQQAARNFIHHGALQDDVFEPNDEQAEVAVQASGVQKLTGLRLSQANEDRFSITFAGPDPRVLTASVELASDVEADVAIRNDEDMVIALASNVGSASQRTLQAVTSAAAAAGTYTVQVVWRGGAAAPYTLSFGSPLELATAEVPEWTVGVPFKADLLASGGVTPYTFAVTQVVPGIAVTENGTRLTGTPTAAGTYSVDVNLSDDAAPKGEIDSSLPFVVNPALSLRTLIAVPAGRTAEVVVGDGGTNALWQPSAPGGLGLTLMGGGTLLLQGQASQPGILNISGTAADAVGAVFGGGAGEAVVCDQLPGRGSSVSVPGDGRFGLWFDALGGSQIDLRLAFASGKRPVLTHLLDAAGAEVSLDQARTRARGLSMRVDGVTAPATGRFFAIFETDGSAGARGVTSRTRVRPQTRFLGQVAIADPEVPVVVPIDALGGSTMRIIVERGQAPVDFKPSVAGLLDPEGNPVSLPVPRSTRRGRRKTISRVRLTMDGRYTLQFGGDGTTTGPLVYRVRVRAPRGAEFSLDD